MGKKGGWKERKKEEGFEKKIQISRVINKENISFTSKAALKRKIKKKEEGENPRWEDLY